MAYAIGQAKICSPCGMEVIWAETQAGKKYLANIREWRGDEGGKKTFLPAHRCQPDGKEEERETAKKSLQAYKDAEAIARGEFPKGVTVKVYKGRKVPVGTQGVVFWTGSDNWGNTRLGIKTAEEETVWVSADHCEII